MVKTLNSKCTSRSCRCILRFRLRLLLQYICSPTEFTCSVQVIVCSRDRTVGIVTTLWAGRSRVRLAAGARIISPKRHTGSGVHPGSYSICTRVFFSPEAKPVPESDSKSEKTLQLSTTNIHNQKVRGYMRQSSVLHWCRVFNTALTTAYVLRNAKTTPRALSFFLTTQLVTLVITNLWVADSRGRRVIWSQPRRYSTSSDNSRNSAWPPARARFPLLSLLWWIKCEFIYTVLGLK